MRPPPLLVITPGDGRDVVPWVRALAAAGLRGLLIREPGLSDDGLAAVLDAARDVRFVAVHHRTAAHPPPGLPLHLSSTVDPGAADVGGRPFGVSCHSADEVDAALAAGAAWTFLSPVWSPTSKPDDRRTPLGPERFLAVARGRPVWALGGVTPERHRALIARGAAGSAVLGDVFGRPTPAAAADRLRAWVD